MSEIEGVTQTTPTPSPQPPASNSDPLLGASLAPTMLELVKEMGAQRAALVEERKEAAKERKSENRWRRGFQLLVFGTPLLYFFFFLSSAGFGLGPFSDVVGVVKVHGEIASGRLASADKIIPALERAFESEHVKAVVLSIDSPGGAPAEAERIYSSIARLKKRNNKPVYSVINNLGASAAYMIAMHTDKVIAGNNSLVGSIGAIMEQFQLDRTLARADVTQVVYASGKLKAFMNPYTAMSAEMDVKAKALVGQYGAMFVKDLQQSRGTSLKAGVDFSTGELWSGVEAKEIGLVDSISTMEDVVASNWGLGTYEFGPSQTVFALIFGSIGSSLDSAFERVLSRAANPRLR